MYLYLDRFGAWCSRVWARIHPQSAPDAAAEPTKA
jgi:hypothetical protein